MGNETLMNLEKQYPMPQALQTMKNGSKKSQQLSKDLNASYAMSNLTNIENQFRQASGTIKLSQSGSKIGSGG